MKYLVSAALCLLLASCEKDINFRLNDVEDVLVVDASIENDQLPRVVLSKSFDYYSNINLEELSKTFVTGADVSIAKDGITHKLKEYSLDLPGGFSFVYYSPDTAAGDNFRGEVNSSYELQITANGKSYSSTTTIPPLSKVIDSIWWRPAPFTDDSTKVTVFVRATDPPGLGNYIRYFTMTNSGPFYPGAQSVFDDQLIDGTTYDLRVDPGINRSDPVSFEDNYFHHGDTVTLKLSNIDKASYQFWLTMEFAYQSIGNPFASPNVVLGNISNGALGAFVGYASGYNTLLIPK